MEFFNSLHAYSDWGVWALRIAIAAVFLVHGLQKVKMWKMNPSEQMSSSMLTIMRILSIAEPLGALAILFGILTQLAALGLGIIMIGAIYFKTQKWGKGFTGDGGWELDFVLLAIAIFFLLYGALAITEKRDYTPASRSEKQTQQGSNRDEQSTPSHDSGDCGEDDARRISAISNVRPYLENQRMIRDQYPSTTDIGDIDSNRDIYYYAFQDDGSYTPCTRDQDRCEHYMMSFQLNGNCGSYKQGWNCTTDKYSSSKWIASEPKEYNDCQ